MSRPSTWKQDCILAVGVLLCTLLIVATTLQHPFPFLVIDEHAHYSYAQALISQQRWWPDFYNFPIYDNAGNPLANKNYMSHPPLFYWAMKLIHPASVDVYRQFALTFNIATLILYAWMGRHANLTPVATTLYALAPVLLTFPYASGLYSNDVWAGLGGCLFCLGSYFLLESVAPKKTKLFILGGLFFSSVKLTSFLLVIGYGFALLLISPVLRRDRIFNWLSAAWVACLALPYLFFWWQWGSPTPLTPGQQDMFALWSQLSAENPHAIFPFFTWALRLALICLTPDGIEFIPPLFMLLIMIFWVVRNWNNQTTLHCMMRSALAATLIVFGLTVSYSYQHYQETGWIVGLYVRFFFPLMPIYGLTIADIFQHMKLSHETAR